MNLKRFFRPAVAAERRLYEAIVAAARHPRAYEKWGVADNLDGRFDMIALYMFVVLERLKEDSQDLRQSLIDAFFADMDRSLREMGVGDLSVGKKVRRMAEVFYGRAVAYDAALAQGGDALEEALARNIFPDGAEPGNVAGLTADMMAMRARLAGMPTAQVLAGEFTMAEQAS